MATDTRMKIANSATIYFRTAKDGDIPQHDISSDDANHSGLGSSVDFVLKAGDPDNNQVTATHHAVVDASETAAISGLTGNSADAIEEGFIFIKNSGYTSSAKTTTTDKYLKVAVGSAISNTAWFTLQPQESIVFHSPFGEIADDTGGYFLQSQSGDIYVEIITGNDE